MGIAIGDYIHLKYKNYRAYGINFKEKASRTPEQALGDVRGRILQQYKNTVNRKDIALIRGYYNFLFDTTVARNFTGLNDQELQQLQQAVLEELYKVIDETKYGINLAQGAAYSLNQPLSNTGGGDSMGLSWTSTNKIREAYHNIVNSSQLLMLKDNMEANEAKVKIEKIHRLISEITQQVSDFGSMQQWQAFDNFLREKEKNIQKRYTRINAGDVSMKGNNLLALMGEVNSYLSGAQLSGAMGSVLGKNLLPSIQSAIQNNAAQGTSEILENLKKMVITNQSAKVTYVTPSASIIGNQKYQPLSYVTKVGQVTVNTESKNPQGINLMIDIGENPIGVSVRNYSPKTVSSKGVQLLRGTNLLNYIHNDTNFANHYFNITAEHRDSRPSGRLLEQAHDMLRLKMAAIGLAGGLTIKNQAGGFKQGAQSQLFIINRRKGGMANFEVYTVEELLENILNNYNLVTMDNYDISWKNEKIGRLNSYRTAYARCLNILQQAHAFQINVSLKSGVFK